MNEAALGEKPAFGSTPTLFPSMGVPLVHEERKKQAPARARHEVCSRRVKKTRSIRAGEIRTR